MGRRVVGVLVVAGLLAGCGSSSVPPPVSATLSWFRAINAHDKPLTLDDFVPADRWQMDWSRWGPAFTNLHCSELSHSATHAQVYCTFNPITSAAAGMSNESFWDVHLQKESSGRWLIDSYGQP